MSVLYSFYRTYNSLWQLMTVIRSLLVYIVCCVCVSVRKSSQCSICGSYATLWWYSHFGWHIYKKNYLTCLLEPLSWLSLLQESPPSECLKIRHELNYLNNKLEKIKPRGGENGKVGLVFYLSFSLERRYWPNIVFCPIYSGVVLHRLLH